MDKWDEIARERAASLIRDFGFDLALLEGAIRADIATALRDAVAEEREACAKVCEALQEKYVEHNMIEVAVTMCARDIRSRGE